MKKAEINVVRFENEDVIATSGAPAKYIASGFAGDRNIYNNTIGGIGIMGSDNLVSQAFREAFTDENGNIIQNFNVVKLGDRNFMDAIKDDMNGNAEALAGIEGREFIWDAVAKAFK